MKTIQAFTTLGPYEKCICICPLLSRLSNKNSPVADSMKIMSYTESLRQIEQRRQTFSNTSTLSAAVLDDLKEYTLHA